MSGEDSTEQDIVTPDQMEPVLQIHKTRPQLKLGASLLQENFISVKQLNMALQKQGQERQTPLGQILIGMGAVTEEIIRRVLSQKFGIPGMNLRKFHVDQNVIKAFPHTLAYKHRVVPLYRINSRLVMAMEDPLARESLQELELCLQSKIDPVLASRADMDFMLQRFYGLLDDHGKNISNLSAMHANRALAEAAYEEAVGAFDEVLIERVNTIITDAISQAASEIHIETMESGKSSKVRLRKDGTMQLYAEIPADFRMALISRIKIMGGLNASEKRRSQTGEIFFEQSNTAKPPVKLRVVTIPTADGLEDIVLRITSASGLMPVEGLGLTPDMLAQLRKLAGKPQGLLLVCGPAGSGKTTTLHSLLEGLNTPERKIWTIEDPIETEQPGLRQIQPDSKVGWTSAAVLHSLLAAGPDVIMVGETRDAETAQAVLEACLAGRLVVSAIHADNAAEGVAKLADFGLNPFSLADVLLGVIAQRLVPRLCPACRKPHIASIEEMTVLARQYCFGTALDPAEVFERWQAQYRGENTGPTLYSPVGCEQCNHRGYKGRIGVYELLVASSSVKNKIRSRADTQNILRAANAEGMLTLRQDGIEKVLQGHTDIQGIQAVCP